jgi:hypothetical protein
MRRAFELFTVVAIVFGFSACTADTDKQGEHTGVMQSKYQIQRNVAVGLASGNTCYNGNCTITTYPGTDGTHWTPNNQVKVEYFDWNTGNDIGGQWFNSDGSGNVSGTLNVPCYLGAFELQGYDSATNEWGWFLPTWGQPAYANNCAQ